MIYADNAATTKLLPSAFEAMKPYLFDEYANASQPYSFARKSNKALKEARTIIADCIGALPEEIYFTSGGTESDNWALKGIVLKDSASKTIVTSQIEHKAVLNSCLALERLGHNVIYLPVNRGGVVFNTLSLNMISSNSVTTPTCQRQVTPPQVGAFRTITTIKTNNDNFFNNGLPRSLATARNDDKKIRIVSVMMANNEVGSIQPIKELCEIAHENEVVFHTDAVQAVGHIPINIHDLGIDLFSASAHKFNGPKGVGFLYIKKGLKIMPLNDGGAQEFGLRAGTENVAGIVGMATALKYNVENIDKNTAKLRILEDILISKLTKAKLDFIHNGSGNRIPGNISLSFHGSDGEMLLHRLDLMGICVSTGSACDSKNTQISHVLKAMQIPKEYAKGTIRISFGKDNTEEDANMIADSLIKILNNR